MNKIKTFINGGGFLPLFLGASIFSIYFFLKGWGVVSNFNDFDVLLKVIVVKTEELKLSIDQTLEYYNDPEFNKNKDKERSFVRQVNSRINNLLDQSTFLIRDLNEVVTEKTTVTTQTKSNFQSFYLMGAFCGTVAVGSLLLKICLS